MIALLQRDNHFQTTMTHRFRRSSKSPSRTTARRSVPTSPSGSATRGTASRPGSFSCRCSTRVGTSTFRQPAAVSARASKPRPRGARSENKKNNPPIRVAGRVSCRKVGAHEPSVQARGSGFRCPRGAGFGGADHPLNPRGDLSGRTREELDTGYLVYVFPTFTMAMRAGANNWLSFRPDGRERTRLSLEGTCCGRNWCPATRRSPRRVPP